VFENKVLRRLFGPKRDEVIGGWRKLYDEGLRGLRSSPSVIRRMTSWNMRLAVHIARMVATRNAHIILVEKTETKSLGRLMRKCVDNVKMNLRDIGCSSVDWIDLTHDRGH
jgi:hypothetical protein